MQSRDQIVGICDLIFQKAEKLTNFGHFKLEVSVCSASVAGASENFWHVTYRRIACGVIKKGFC